MRASTASSAVARGVPSLFGRPIARHGVLVALAVFGAGAIAPVHGQHKGPDAPSALFLRYSCKPEKRPAFRGHMEGPGVAQFEKWKRQGVFRDYLILFSSYVSPEWDMLIRLEFDKYADTEKWKAIERMMPAGLSAEGLALCSPTNAHLADLLYENARPIRDLARARFTVFTFEYKQTRVGYQNYFVARPKFDLDGSVEDGIMTSYGVYGNQYNLGPAWDILWLLEYRDAEALGSREIVRHAVRKRVLEAAPAFAYARAAGGEVEDLEQAVIADAILPR